MKLYFQSVYVKRKYYLHFFFQNLSWHHMDGNSISDLCNYATNSVNSANLLSRYDRILTRIRERAGGKGWRIVNNLFAWVLIARRPMKWSEIQTAISMDIENGTIDLTEKMLRVGIRDLCGSLVQEKWSGRVEFVHYTVKELVYLSV